MYYEHARGAMGAFLPSDSTKKRKVAQQTEKEAADQEEPTLRHQYPPVGTMVHILADTAPGVISYLSAKEVGEVTEVRDNHCLVRLVLGVQHPTRQISDPHRLLVLCKGGANDYDFPQVGAILQNRYNQIVKQCTTLAWNAKNLELKLANQRNSARVEMNQERHDATIRLIEQQERLEKHRHRAEMAYKEKLVSAKLQLEEAERERATAEASSERMREHVQQLEARLKALEARPCAGQPVGEHGRLVR